MRNKPTPPRSRRLRPSRWAIAVWGFTNWGSAFIALRYGMENTPAGFQVLIIAVATCVCFLTAFGLIASLAERDRDARRRADEDDARTGVWLHPDGRQLIAKLVPDSGWWYRIHPGDWTHEHSGTELRRFIAEQEGRGFLPILDDGTRWAIGHLNRAAGMS